ncbi:MAG TPA: hypothetical protein VE196_02200 [Pseudonocardiaceae bacterium]|nr:hypothetical protein [Pseudonocardiaceae bacterium]
MAHQGQPGADRGPVAVERRGRRLALQHGERRAGFLVLNVGQLPAGAEAVGDPAQDVGVSALGVGRLGAARVSVLDSVNAPGRAGYGPVLGRTGVTVAAMSASRTRCTG